MQGDTVRIRLYEKGDEQQITRLFQEVYGKPLTIKQWQWKYLGLGNLRVWASVAFNEKGELVAHYGGIPVRMLFRGRHIIACQCVDAMARSGYRAKDMGIPQTESIFYRVCNLLYDTFGTFFYTFPGDVCYNWGKKTGHIEECLEVPEYRYQCDKRVSEGLLYSFSPVDWGDPEIDRLWDRVCKDLGWVMVRDREFIQWRYQDNPFFKHYPYAVKGIFSHRFLALAVVRESGNDLLVMDLVFEDAVLEILLRKLINHAHSRDKKQIKIWLPDRYKSRLMNIGFKPCDIRTWIPNLTRYRVATAREVSENLYYTMGDTDFL